MTAAQQTPRLPDIEHGTWVLADDTSLTYEAEPGRPARRRMRIWTTAEGPWTICVVTETGRESGLPVASAPDAALAAIRDRYGPGAVLFDDYEPAGESYMQPTRYSWLNYSSTGQPFWVAFPPRQLRTTLPGLIRTEVLRAATTRGHR